MTILEKTEKKHRLACDVCTGPFESDYAWSKYCDDECREIGRKRQCGVLYQQNKKPERTYPNWDMGMANRMLMMKLVRASR